MISLRLLGVPSLCVLRRKREQARVPACACLYSPHHTPSVSPVPPWHRSSGPGSLPRNNRSRHNGTPRKRRGTPGRPGRGLAYHERHACPDPPRPARQAPWLLRRGRPRGADRRGGAGAATAPRSTCASRSCTTSTWSRSLEARGAMFVEETEEVPEGAVVVFSAHGVAPQVREEARKRGLHTIDATCPLVTKVHSEAGGSPPRATTSCSSATRATRRSSARPARRRRTSSWSTGRRKAPASRCATPPRSSGCRRPRCRWTRPTRPWPRCGSGSRCWPTRQATTSATPRRTGRPRSRQIASQSDLVIVVGSHELLQLGAAGRGGGQRRRPCGVPGGRRGVDATRPGWTGSTVGLSSGASVPEDLVAGVLERLAAKRLRPGRRGRGGGGADVLRAAARTAAGPRRTARTSARPALGWVRAR